MSKKKSGKKNSGVPNAGNRELYDAMFAKRLSSAASTHDARPNRQRTRATVKAQALKDY